MPPTSLPALPTRESLEHAKSSALLTCEAMRSLVGDALEWRPPSDWSKGCDEEWAEGVAFGYYRLGWRIMRLRAALDPVAYWISGHSGSNFSDQDQTAHSAAARLAKLVEGIIAPRLHLDADTAEGIRDQVWTYLETMARGPSFHDLNSPTPRLDPRILWPVVWAITKDQEVIHAEFEALALPGPELETTIGREHNAALVQLVDFAARREHEIQPDQALTVNGKADSKKEPIVQQADEGDGEPEWNGLKTVPGGFVYRGQPKKRLSAKPLGVLRAALQSRSHIIRADSVLSTVWKDRPEATKRNVGDAVGEVRRALREALDAEGVECDDPFSCISESPEPVAWELKVPPPGA